MPDANPRWKQRPAGSTWGDFGPDDQGGGLFVVDLDTREAAQALTESDPFYQAELFAQVRTTRWRTAYVAGQSSL